MEKLKNIEFVEYGFEDFNKQYGTNIDEYMKIVEITDHIEEKGLSYFYASYNPDDILLTIEDEWDVAEHLKIDYVCIDGLFIAIY